MDQTQIEEETSHKHLGVVLSNDCTWHGHQEYIKSKAWTRVNIMRKLKYKLDRLSPVTDHLFFLSLDQSLSILMSSGITIPYMKLLN